MTWTYAWAAHVAQTTCAVHENAKVAVAVAVEAAAV
jgi:hypothetical protein